MLSNGKPSGNLTNLLINTGPNMPLVAGFAYGFVPSVSSSLPSSTFLAQLI
jgi:hypothetical protein